MDTLGFNTLKIHILLVDDRPENLAVLKAILNNPSYTLIEATTGEQALMYVLKQDFALILLDVFMGQMDGYEVASMIKSRNKSKHIPIIFLTAMVKDIDNIFKAYSIGAVDYIQKPLEPHIVRAKVAVFSELYRNKQQIKYQAELIRQSELREKEYQLLEIKRAGERKFQDLVEGINHGFVWSADPESFTFTYVSPRAELILGYPIEQWHSERGFWINHLFPEDRESILNTFRKAQMGRDLGHDHRFITSDGETVWLHTGVRLARRGEEAGYEIRGLSVDITHLKQIESALRDAVQVRDEFLSIASHELKTPITPMKLQVQALERAIKRNQSTTIDSKKVLKVIELWNRQLDRLSHLVEDLLDVSRISTGRLSIKREVIDLSEIVHEIADRYHLELKNANCDIKLSLEKGIHGLWDRIRIEQVITNLITNAIKYAPGKPIAIKLHKEHDKAILSVQDHGPGISELDQIRIFDRFERATSSSHQGGLGLGLYITRQIVLAHEGTIQVESQPKHGATFRVELPIVSNSKGKNVA